MFRRIAGLVGTVLEPERLGAPPEASGAAARTSFPRWLFSREELPCDAPGAAAPGPSLVAWLFAAEPLPEDPVPQPVRAGRPRRR
jgi:hypothetical protein